MVTNGLTSGRGRATSPTIMDQKQANITTADILRDFLTQKINRNPSFSLRAFARDLNVSHTYLSLVLNGKKTLSMKKVVLFCNILKLDERAAGLFIQAGAREAKGRAFEKVKEELGSGKKGKKSAFSKGRYFELETDRFRLLEDWYHLPILDLTLLDNFENDPEWIARKLDLAPAQARDSLERLKRLGLLEERDGRLIKTHANMFVQPKRPDQDVRKYHRNMINRALSALESGDPEDVAARDITGVMLPIDPDLLPEARERIAKFRRSLWKFLSSGKKTELYHLNIQMIPLTRRRGPRGVAKAEILKRGCK